MRVVSREQLVEVYHALWGAEALHGSMETFLGLQAKAALLRVVRAFLLAARFAFRCAPG